MFKSLNQMRAYWASKKERIGTGLHPGDLGHAAREKARSYASAKAHAAVDPLYQKAYTAGQKAMGAFAKGKAAVFAAPEFGKSHIRTFGQGWAERGFAGGVGILHAMAESMLAHKVEASSTRLQEQLARLAGSSQKFWTEEGFRHFERARGGASRFVGPLTERERAMVAGIHQRIRQQMEDLDKLRSLRRVQNPSESAAARAAIAQMQATGQRYGARHGDIPDPILAHVMQNYVGADTPRGRERIRRLVESIERTGS